MAASLLKDKKDNANKSLLNAEEKGVNNNPIILSENVEKLLSEKFDNKSLQAIKEIYEKTESLKNASKINDKEVRRETYRKISTKTKMQVQENFKNIKARLNQSSACLTRIKQELENINFSYSKNVLSMHNSLHPGDFFDPTKNPIRTKEEMERKMEEIRIRIDDIQKELKDKKEKNKAVSQSFQEAFEDVVDRLQAIDKGKYSSNEPKTEENKE